MKFLHLGDLHLGRSLGDYDLYDDQKYILDRIIDIVKNKSVDAVLISGDVYDKAIPSEAAVNLLDYFLRAMVLLKKSVYMISGNHDSDDRLNFGSSLFESNGIYISSVFNGELYKKTVTDEFGEIDIYLLPFVKASQVKRYYPDAKIESYDDAVKTIIAEAEIDSTRRNIIVSHQFVAGKGKDASDPLTGDTSEPLLGGSESLGTKNVGLVEKIGYDCFDSFSYAALGHIHSPQRIGRDEVRYSGSPLKYSLSEANNDKSVPVVTVGEGTEVAIELVPLKPMRDLRHIKGPLNELLDKKNVKAPDDFIYATLTDEDVINDAMGIFRQVYPNTIKIDYDNSHTRELSEVDITKIVKNRTFNELISDFYEMIYGCKISDEEMAVMDEVAREAGVKDETN